VAQAEISSLRDRREDFGALINYCLERSGYGHLGVSSTLMWALLRNPWPDELEGLERLLNNQAVSAPRGSDYLDLTPSTEALLEPQLRAWAPQAQDDSTVDIVATP
jgi:transcriptional regulator of acetoin/glycerol metabolism